MKFILNKDTLEVDEVVVGNSGSVNYYEAEVEYDESWNDLTIEAIIVKKDEDVGTSIAVINNKFFIDKNLSGTYYIGFVGYIIENDKKTYQISSNLKGIYFDKGAGEIETENEELPTPTEWEIYIAEITKIFNDIETLTNGLNEKVEEVETKLTNGEFNGKDATINGKNAIEIEAGNNINIEETKNGIKINAINAGAVAEGIVDDELSIYSENPVQNKVIANVIDNTFEKKESSNLYNNTYSETEEVDGLTLTYTKGYAKGAIDDNGVIITGTRNVTYPIKVVGGTRLYFKATTNQTLYTIGPFVYFYDKNKNFIEKRNANTDGVVVPDNARYMRLSDASGWSANAYPTLSYDNTTGTPFEAYFEPYYITIDKELRNGLNAKNKYEKPINAINHEYNVNLVDSLKYELAILKKQLFELSKPTVLDSGKCGENLTWTLYSDGLLKISGTGRSYDYVKGTLIGLTREEIEAQVTSGKIPEYYAFQEGKTYDDENAQYVAPWYKYRPENDFETYTSEEAYNAKNPNGYKYNRIEIEKGITYLGDWMFYRVCGVTEIVVPEGVTEIGKWCIRFCTSVIVVNLPDSLTTIGEYGISRHEDKLKAIKFGKSLTNIGKMVLQNNAKLETLVFPDSLQTTGDNCCEGCSSLKYVYTGGLTNIPNSAFANCVSLEDIKITNTVKSIGTSAFFKTAIKSLHIPESVETMQTLQGQQMTNLEEVWIDSPTLAANLWAPHVNYVKNVYFREDINVLHGYFTKVYTKGITCNGYTLYTYNG